MCSAAASAGAPVPACPYASFRLATLWRTDPTPLLRSFEEDGVSACSEYYFDKVSITVELPAGTDVSALKPVFASADAQQITVNGEQQISGETVVDFTEPVVYTLTTRDGDVSVESTVEVSVSLL